MTPAAVCILCWDATPRPMLTQEHIQAGIPPERLVSLPVRWAPPPRGQVGYGDLLLRPPIYILHLRSDDNPTSRTKCGMTIPEGEA